MAVLTVPTQKFGEYQKRFRTYHNYFRAWQMLLEDRYGATPSCPLYAVTSHNRYPSLLRNTPAPPSVITYLRNAWSTEFLLRLPLSLQPGDTGDLIATYSCAWAPVQAYYSIYSALIATSHAEGQMLNDHTATLNFASRLIEYPWVPEVFSYWGRGYSPLKNLSYQQLMTSPGCCQVSNLSIPSDLSEALAMVRMCLKTTRDDILNERVRVQREKKRRTTHGATMRKAEKNSMDAGLRAVTLFDFLYRVRCRCNYRETDTFIKGATIEGTSVGFLNAINTVVSHTLAFLETVICGRIGTKAMAQIVNDYFQETNSNCITPPVAERWGLVH